MKKKLLLVFVLILSGLIFIFQTYNTIKFYAVREDDTQISVLNQKVSYQSSKKFTNLLTDDKLNFNFVAKYNNLGTVAFLFDTKHRINTDWLWFRIKENDVPNWYYENKYKTDQFSSNRYFPFGFPVIENSQAKKYLVQIESISGTPDNSVSLSKKTNSFLIKYSFSKSFLAQNKLQIVSFTKNKLEAYLSYIPFFKKIEIAFSSLLPLFIWLVIFVGLKFKMSKKLGKAFDRAFLVIIFFITFFVSGFFSTIGTDPHHDGILIKPAVDLLEGKMLFRDSFTQYGALTTILQTFVLKLFGKYLITIKLETAFFYALISVLLYFVWSRFMSKKLAFLSSIILLFLAPYYIFTFLPWSSVYALFFQCLTLYFLIKNNEGKNKRWLFFAGVATALTFWSKQNVGAFVLMSSIISIIMIQILTRKKLKTLISNLIQYIHGGIFISMVFLLWIIANGGLIDWWKQSIVFATGFIETKSNTSLIGSLFPSYVYPSYVGFICIWAVIPIATIVAFLKGLFEKKSNIAIVVVSLFGLFSWLQYYPITDIRHVFWSAAPMVGIVIYLLSELSKSVSQKRTVIQFLLFLFLIWAFFYPDIRYRIDSGYKKITAIYYSLENPRILKGMKLTKNEATFYSQTYEAIIDYKKTHGNVNFITNSPNALYLTFARSDNFHPMYADFGNTIYPDYYIIKNDYIERNKPLIMSIWGQIHPGYCRLNNFTNSSDTAFLIAPCEKAN